MFFEPAIDCSGLERKISVVVFRPYPFAIRGVKFRPLKPVYRCGIIYRYYFAALYSGIILLNGNILANDIAKNNGSF